jgi:hypothetical protein
MGIKVKYFQTFSKLSEIASDNYFKDATTSQISRGYHIYFYLQNTHNCGK